MKSNAALLLIGDELLTGKVRDENGYLFAQTMFQNGVFLDAIEVIPDTESIIVERLNYFRKLCTYVVTSGGIGPTHDDRTLSAIAEAFQVPLVLHERSYQFFSEHQKNAGRDEKVSLAQQKMICYPKTAEVFHLEPMWLPLVKVENVYIFPGVPNLFKRLLEGFAHIFQGGKFYLEVIHTDFSESVIAAPLEEIQNRFSDTKIGSYPQPSQASCRVKVTVEGENEDKVKEVTRLLLPLINGRIATKN